MNDPGRDKQACTKCDLGIGRTLLAYLWPLWLPGIEDVERAREPWRKLAVARNRARIRPHLGLYIKRWTQLAGILYLSGATLEHAGLLWAGVASFWGFVWSLAAIAVLAATRLLMGSVE